jgi:hypothetical protein
VDGTPDQDREIMWFKRKKSVDTPKMGWDKGGVEGRLPMGVAIEPSGTAMAGG